MLSRFKFFSFKKLTVQMVVYFLGIALIPLAIVSYINYRNAVKELHNMSSTLLLNMAQKQKGDIANYMNEQRRTLSFLARSPDIERPFTLLNKIKEVIRTDENPDYFEEMRRKLEPVLKDFIEKSDFKQLLLINLDGGILLSVGKANPLYTNILTGSLSNTELAYLFQRTVIFLTPQISDFGLIPPSTTYDLFMATPVFNEERLAGVLVAQFDIEDLFDVINEESGRIGSTGETVVGAKIGNVMTMLNPTRFQSQPFVQLTTTSEESKEATVTFMEALSWTGGIKEIVDYRGQKVLAAWEYLPNMRWGLIVKMDMSEILIPVVKLRRLTLMIALIVCAVVLLVGIGITHSLTKPIISLTKVASTIASGDLTATVGEAPKNEIGILANAIKAMASNLKVVVTQIKGWGKELAETTEDVSKVMDEQSLAAQETGKASIDITASSRRISSLARELSGTMHEVSEVVQDTALLAESGIDGLHIMEAAMNELTAANTEVSQQLGVIQEKADGISSIVTTMTKVADQTNLLSLNAAIEARQAGTYGKGFKVVALEIKRLADQVAASTLEIENMIGDMLKAVHKGVTSMQHLSTKVEYEAREITNVSTHLTNVIQQVQGLPVRFETVVQGMESQTERADQIKDSITRLSQSAQLTVTSLDETTKKLSTLKKAAGELQHEISKFKDK